MGTPVVPEIANAYTKEVGSALLDDGIVDIVFGNAVRIKRPPSILNSAVKNYPKCHRVREASCSYSVSLWIDFRIVDSSITGDHI